ncbi:hypothetical protein HN992_03315 [Candidatus Woesearchaeota archaeon]|jgi:hypothetical protein|nr:hypothetical protein [Candidatus Woesearchaeota archaeon]MBT3438916.1 hypothetical protein [Candidatus Woesearchaeota archaeon]MBT4058198.1 hypothetical protein [Candidatus Woesearchaeota archaeon]MBT4206837.1 hypothetical protein [Candidatus Woesearchaeota archaeon]MBT4731011.1 hypothetical protein [Candidatus Woesearchaeota archaeon]
MEILNIREDLNKIQGLKVLKVLDDGFKERIMKLEEANNHGVFESLTRRHTLLLSHDSSFRDPTQEIVKSDDKGISFPGISFPEINADNVISSSPGFKMHKELIDSLNLSLKPNEATLLVGFDL